ncbi:hypothetical protein [Halosimplex pelagicum]|uniref:Uncharacterized protein n=1 Tax=Halosimplex pelagicum TaxID=869886 RepID=A0A7D5P5G4_9EURY|nr:hypothetical protein [Halosimplex pelagicum]QLH81246.1 hypothetical protein HZS54_06160 [Halosimplex pelagicum]
MACVQSGTGYVLVVPRVVCHQGPGPTELPLAALVAGETALGRLADDVLGSDLLPRATADPDGSTPAEPSVSLDPDTETVSDAPGALDASKALGTTDPSETGEEPELADQRPGMAADAGERDSFVLGVHAASVGDGDPTSPASLVGVRVLAPGEYRGVPVPVWEANPFPISAPSAVGERPRTEWTDTGLTPEPGGRRRIEVTATLWADLGGDAERSRPLYDGLGWPVTDSRTVTFGHAGDAGSDCFEVAR